MVMQSVAELQLTFEEQEKREKEKKLVVDLLPKDDRRAGPLQSSEESLCLVEGLLQTVKTWNEKSTSTTTLTVGGRPGSRPFYVLTLSLSSSLSLQSHGDRDDCWVNRQLDQSDHLSIRYSISVGVTPSEIYVRL